MPRFTYTAIDRSGALVKGDISAPDDLAAMDQLNRQGLTPVSVEEGGQAEAWWQRDISLSGDTNKLKSREQAQFFGTLQTMLTSGFTVTRALTFAANQARTGKPKRILTTISDNVRAGGTLAGAMEESGGFQPRLIRLVRIGESANRLKEVSASIAEMLQSEIRGSQQVRQALVYPTILLAMSVLVLMMLIFFLAPTLVPVFRSAGAAPPALLSALDGTGTFLREQWPSALLGVGGLVFAFFVLRRSIFAIGVALASALPGLRSYVRAKDTLRFLQTLQLMLGSGAQLPTALGTAVGTAASSTWREGIEEIRSRVEAGDTLSAALRESGLAEESALAFVEAGEEGDQMVAMLGQGCRLLEERTSGQLAQALRLLTPILTLLIGATVGLLIFSTIGAILDLNDLAS